MISLLILDGGKQFYVQQQLELTCNLHYLIYLEMLRILSRLALHISQTFDIY